MAPTLTFPARIAFNADAVAHVGSQVKGRVVEVRAPVGASVRRGDELLIVESPEYAEAQGDYLQKRVGAVAAQAAVDAAKVSYDRAKALQEKNQGIALAEVQKREAEWRAAQASARTAEAALLSAQSKLKLSGWDEQRLNALMKSGGIEPRLPVHAPISGKVVEREVTLGELVTPERDALLILADVDRLWVLADVPETRLAEVIVGAPARVHVAAVRGQVFEGKVSQIAPTLNAETRTASVRIEVPNPDGKLRPGMFASAELSTAALGGAVGEAVLAIPDEAVQTVEGRTAVFVPVEGEDNTFAARPVTVGKAVGGMVPVLSGLEEGERTVTGGSFVLKAELGKGGAGHDHDH
jgi:cobalt-zinc-cadmium efflux system membrane fusion protein